MSCILKNCYLTKYRNYLKESLQWHITFFFFFFVNQGYLKKESWDQEGRQRKRKGIGLKCCTPVWDAPGKLILEYPSEQTLEVRDITKHIPFVFKLQFFLHTDVLLTPSALLWQSILQAFFFLSLLPRPRLHTAAFQREQEALGYRRVLFTAIGKVTFWLQLLTWS